MNINKKTIVKTCEDDLKAQHALGLLMTFYNTLLDGELRIQTAGRAMLRIATFLHRMGQYEKARELLLLGYKLPIRYL